MQYLNALEYGCTSIKKGNMVLLLQQRIIQCGKMERESLNFIYGVGKYGQLLLGYLCSFIQIDYFVQTEEPTEKNVKGIPVLSFREMMDISGEKTIFVAIKNKKVVSKIMRRIYEEVSSQCRVYDYSSFIDDNLLMPKMQKLYGEKFCVLCENKFDEFLPDGIEEEIFKKHHIIGGGYRENCICPYCGCNDRARWLYYVLKNKTDIFEISGRVLHFAPEKSVTDYIKQNEKIDYYTCDVVPGKAMHIVDITDIPYKENTFDYVICNHVMEHIIDERKAVSEIKRVLEKDGKWIFSFPICTDMETYEDKAIVTPEDRLKKYGQEDHVRLYGKDYINRFQSYGLELQIMSPEKELGCEQIKQYGFIKDDVILIARKK